MFYETCTGQVLTSILMNSTSLFQNDLVGVHVLLPHFVSALEIVLPVKKHEFRFAMPQHDLRRSCIRLTLSIIMLPHHFRELPIADVTQPAADPDSTFQQLSQTYTFLSFHERLAALLFSALRIEQDPGNIHLLLCSVQLLVQDAATFEALSRKAEAASSTSTSDKQPLPKVASDTHVTADGEFAIPKISDDAISEGSGTPLRLRRGHRSAKGWDAAGLFVRACRDIPQRFLHPKTDLSVTLSVLELLASLAQLDIPTVDPSEWQFTVKWLCDYIATLVGQPRPSHIRDLHSMIVAAYQCLQAWIMAKHRVLCEKDSLHHVLEVIELGLSGSKSEHLPSDTGDGDGPKRQLKGEKERHPVSIRVREAAEVLFFCITEHLGSFPSPCGPAVASCQVTETEMLALAAAADPSAKNATLRYFVLDSSTVIGVLEHSISPHSDTSPPTVTILSRTPAGKRCWTMQLRHWPRSAGAQANDHLKPVKGPDPKSDEAIEPTILKQFWPEAADSIEPIKADYSIPSLDQILDSRTEVEQAKLHDAVKKQATAEADALTKHHQSGDIKSSMQATRVDPPPCCASFQTSRLFLSHLGVLSLENLQAAAYRPQPALVSLDNTTPALAAALHDLDSMPTRNTENVYVLYVRTGQSKLTDIFRNKGTLRSPPFHEFLLSLGWPVDILSHPGWKGPFSSPRFKFCKLNPTPYYADITVEMLFVVPSLQPQVPFLLDSCTPVATVGSPKLPSVQNITDGVELKEELTLSNSDRVSHSAPTSPTDLAGRRAHTVTQTPPNRLGLKRPGTRPTNSASSDLALGVVWLERFEDYETFPLEDFSHAMNMLDNPNASTSSSIQLSKHGVDCVVIFIHPLNTGLYRIKVASTLNRGNCGGPLLDGMAVSRRVLGLLVRQTVINITRRRRLDTDSCVPPHVPRKRKIEEMTTQFEQKYTIPQFFDSLFAHAYTASHE
ncbi:ral GTPase-activating protein subunit beta-like isoform X2 [Corticium candelabrum]|uniref:ral GTPase-activating protein subunit beta-like isoform X2 n=1 Tax=Corticium candelabrum TaxID=121492 RepID=UPI002E273352|nr:ral GTPase-activating protein subunit beta-like isoform X2 [Corticium candelabrum]